VAWTAVALLVLGACATAPPRDETPLDPARQREVIAGLDDWKFDGRVAVAAPGQGFNASMNWTQTGGDSSVQLASPLGAGSLRVRFGVQPLRVESSGGQKLEGPEALAALHDQLGFEPPLESLRFWLVGLPAPGREAQEQRSPDGSLLSLAQDGWLVEYQQYQLQRVAAGQVRMPTRLRATRESFRLRVAVDRWALGR
jgi:outer membrane lipoprotein LolB